MQGSFTNASPDSQCASCCGRAAGRMPSAAFPRREVPGFRNTALLGTRAVPPGQLWQPRRRPSCVRRFPVWPAPHVAPLEPLFVCSGDVSSAPLHLHGLGAERLKKGRPCSRYPSASLVLLHSFGSVDAGVLITGWKAWFHQGRDRGAWRFTVWLLPGLSGVRVPTGKDKNLGISLICGNERVK